MYFPFIFTLIQTDYGLKVENYTTSWKDGRAFCAIIHYYFPQELNYYELKTETEEEILENHKKAFDVAEKHNVYKILDPEDMLTPDKQSVTTYLAMWYKEFKPLPQGIPERKDRKNSDSPLLKKESPLLSHQSPSSERESNSSPIAKKDPSDLDSPQKELEEKKREEIRERLLKEKREQRRLERENQKKQENQNQSEESSGDTIPSTESNQDSSMDRRERRRLMREKEKQQDQSSQEINQENNQKEKEKL